MFCVAIDGPGGAGKSTVAKAAASRMDMQYVDTGAMFRAVAYALIQRGIDPEDEAAIKPVIGDLNVRVDYIDHKQIVSVEDVDVTPYIRTPEVGQGASKVGVHGCVREKLLAIQRQVAEDYSVIMDGRDIGTVVLPMADLKLFITASAEERAKRRYKELVAAGNTEADLATIEAEIRERDYRDSHRAIAPLKQADDAYLLDTTEMTLDEVINKVCAMIEEARNR
ncbi:MAG: (d)CMP kinase [Firmicutes bacterium]|nr:(d)CMP kinase [Bacillota bacterium]